MSRTNINKLLITLKETTKIEKAINKIEITNVRDPTFTEKSNAYLAYQAKSFLNQYYPRYQLKEYNIYTFQYAPRWLFFVIITNPNTNHPFLMYTNLDEKKLYVILPLGKDSGQVELFVFRDAIEECVGIEKFAFFFFIERTIYIRKFAILYNKQFTLIDCNNISNCVKKLHEIMKMNISIDKKKALQTKYNDFYLHKATDMLKEYFDMLELGEYDEAFLFLRGDKGKYFKKERLNTFFKDTKAIIGHLQIFIALYQLLNQLRLRVFNV